MTRQIAEAILDGGIASVHFFNGRLLTAEDLTQEQAANRAWRLRLGQALGDGVARGLGVVRGPGDARLTPVVTVTPGLAVNRLGETVALDTPVDLSLVGADPAAAAAPGDGTDASDFSCCQPPQSGTYVSGAGVYLLTIQPARGPTGRVPVNGLDTATVSCNIRSDLEGVRFRLVPLNLDPDELADADRLRNRVAHECLGTAEVRAAWVDPVNAPLTYYGLLDSLRPDRLTDADVPLALVDWTEDDGIRSLDAWAVRRRLTRPSAVDPWGQPLGDRRRAEAEAALLQFQDHARDLVAGPAPDALQALDHFRFLPPAGVLPLGGLGGSRGFRLTTFFQGLTTLPPVVIEGARVESLLTASLAYPPFDLAEKELIRLYVVRQNLQPGPAGVAPPFAVFASGHVPFHGQARYDVARWGYANYS
jgi:hypothetical protein